MNYYDLFKQKPDIEVQMPYRVNWCGAYLDCIKQPVLTSVLTDRFITIEGKRNYSNTICIYSDEMEEIYSVPINFVKPKEKRWTDYVDGCIAILAQNYVDIKYGANLIVHNDLPSGLGLGSSAAFVMALIWAICCANDIDPTMNDLVKWGYMVEYCYLDIPCGLMDYKAIAHLPGIYMITTDDWDLNKDQLIDDHEYPLLVVYDKNVKHRHLGSDLFRDTVQNMVNEIDIFPRYIKTENNILKGMKNVLDVKVDETEFPMICWDLGIGMNWSQRNLEQIVSKLTPVLIPNHPAIYGSKTVGSGRKGCMIVLYKPEQRGILIKAIREINQPDIRIKPVFA